MPLTVAVANMKSNAMSTDLALAATASALAAGHGRSASGCCCCSSKQAKAGELLCMADEHSLDTDRMEEETEETRALWV